MTLSASLADTKAQLESARLALARGEGRPTAYRELVDGLVSGFATTGGWTGRGRALVALGGYGRGELAPRSDIDLLFLVERHGKDLPSVDAVLYPLWDYGFEVGHAIRTPAECRDLAREDLTAATALLESRCLVGDEMLLDTARRRSGIAPEGTKESRRWVSRIVAEVNRRREHMGEISLLLEPHVKEGKGGLRDFQASRWVLECLGVDPARGIAALPRGEEAASSYQFLSQVRNVLHVVAGRKTDHFTFDFHRDVAAFFCPGDPIETFFARLHAAGHRISSLWDEAVLASQEAPVRSFPWSRPLADPTAGELERELEQWCRAGGSLAPRVRRALPKLGDHGARDVLVPLAGRLLRSRAPLAPLLHELDRCGKLGAVLPELEAVVHHVRYDARHAYTTGVHCLEALAAVENLWFGLQEKEEPALTRVASRLDQPHVVRLAALCHDFGLDAGPQGHEESGSHVGRSVALRFGFTADEAEAVATLIREHSSLPTIALGSDLESPASWEKARRAAAPPASLDALLVLAYADLSATRPRGAGSAWSEWTRDLVLTLCARADACGAGSGACDNVRVPPTAAAGAPRREFSQVPPDLLQRLLSLAAGLGERSSVWEVAFRTQNFVEILGVAHGSPRVLSSTTGVLSALRLDILSIQVHRWRDGTVHLWIRASSSDAPPPTAAIAERLEAVASGAQALPRRSRSALGNPREEAVPVEVRVGLFDGDDPYHSVLDVQCKDRRGLLYDLARVFESLGISVVYALVTTAGPVARDVFHLQDIFGCRIEGEEKVKTLVERVRTAVQPRQNDCSSSTVQAGRATAGPSAASLPQEVVP